MAEVAKLVGIETRDYTGQDVRQRQYCGLHLVHLEGSVRRVNGCKAETVSCPREIDPRRLQLGGTYQLEYETFETRNGNRHVLLIYFRWRCEVGTAAPYWLTPAVSAEPPPEPDLHVSAYPAPSAITITALEQV